MTYIRNGRRAHLDALRIQQQIAAAEVEQTERELAEIQAAEQELARLQRRRERAEQGLKQAQARQDATRIQLTLPVPIHGGREGLEAAVREAAEWLKRKRGGMNAEGHSTVFHADERVPTSP